jgi:ABC-type multidrug transport system fused ATPase/permease subunit
LFLSLRWLLSRSTARARGYEALDTHEADDATAAAHETDIPPEEDELDDEAALSMPAGRVALAHVTSKGHTVEANSPAMQTFSVVVEELAVAGIVAIHAVPFVYEPYRPHGHHYGTTFIAQAAGLAIWTYVLVLTSLRLFLGKSSARYPYLWIHTAVLYGLLWLLNVCIFRSVILYPISDLAQKLAYAEFGLVTLLTIISLTTRRGNRTVLLEWEDGIEPSHEQTASVLSSLSFYWLDSLLHRGFKKPMDMDMVWNLLPSEKAAAVLSDYRALKKTTRLSIHLLKHFRGPLVAQALLACLYGVLVFLPTVLLQKILEYVESPEGQPRNVVWLYVVLIPLSDVIRSFADNCALWIGRKICIKIRAIIVGEIYAKALRRRASAGKKKTPETTSDGFWARLKRRIGLGKKDQTPQQTESNGAGGNDNNGDAASATSTVEVAAPKDQDDGADDSQQANVGTIINLMSTDSFRIAEVTAYLHYLTASAPVQLVIAIAMLWRVMGVSALPALGVMVLLLPVNYLIARGFTSTSRRIQKTTDKRLHRTNEVLNNIRIIKYFAWEQRFASLVNEDRRKELLAIRSRYIVWAFAVVVWNSVPVVITFLSFLVYTLVEEKSLYPSVAFTAMSLFMLLRVPLDQIGDMLACVQETVVSIERVEEFLMEEETEKYDQLQGDNVDADGNRVIGFEDSTLSWGSRDADADADGDAFRLLDINVQFQIGKLNIISGATGSGKTSMLMGLLGEMTRLDGKVYCPGGRSREDIRVDASTGYANSVAYVAQTAWLINANIKENILFSREYDEQRYHDVIVACALERDLDILDHGDETLVGEKGISLSGGQKQRICLARAIYSNSQHLLLDDCLSAVDSHTAHWIFGNCIRGPLMDGRTCIMVTHNTPLCVPSSDFVVVLDNGRIVAQGPPNEVIASGKLGDDVQASRPVSESVSRIPSRVPSSVGSELAETQERDAAAARKNKPEKEKKNLQEETKATGSVKWPVLKLYLSSMGGFWFWLVTAVVFGLNQISGLVTNLWIREWSGQYQIEGTAATTPYRLEAQNAMSPFSASPLGANTHSASWVPHAFSNGSTAAAASISPQSKLIAEVNALHYLTILAVIGLAGAFATLMRDVWLFYGSLTASRKIHKRLMQAILHARLKFFDTTPLGQIVNRFSKDLSAVDQDVAPVAIGVISCTLALLLTIALISYFTPAFLVVGVVIMVLYGFIAAFYLRSSRDLKRLESVQRSPIFQQFGETLAGMTTIRAFRDERRFIRDNLARINQQSRPFILLWACNRWLGVRTDFISDGVAFFAGVFIILSIGKIDAGAAGISLSYALAFTENLLWVIRLYGTNEQNMNSVERIKEYLDTEQEAAQVIEDSRPPAEWPERGQVEFVNYSTRYRAELEPVLRNISLKIKPGEKVGIVGRTGAGKSSLTLAMFRALEADEGKILIDGIDIGTIGLKDLRSSVTLVPQEATLFQGTIRTNLDPFDLYPDEDLFDVLRQVQLIGDHEQQAGGTAPSSVPQTPPNNEPAAAEANEGEGSAAGASSGAATATLATNRNVFLDLSSSVAESGSNLSQGQRQLLCLARAMLRKPRVLVMDEATASIDYKIDSKIQQTIRQLTSTTITIAHRLQTIADYDKVLVLDQGSVVEFDHPHNLIQKAKGGTFRDMCEASGDFDKLARTAEAAWRGAGGLVDVDGEGEVDDGPTQVEGDGMGVTED